MSSQLASLIEKCLNAAGINDLPGMEGLKDALRSIIRDGNNGLRGNGAANNASPMDALHQLAQQQLRSGSKGAKF